jgi:hypothetical protein
MERWPDYYLIIPFVPAAVNHKSAAYSISVFIGACVLQILLGFWLFGDERRPVLKLEKRAESRSFFRTKKDELLLMPIGVIPGAVSTLLVQSLLKPPAQSTSNPVSTSPKE